MHEMKYDRVLVWLRNDLRLHDNEALWRATQDAGEVIPVFVFDPRSYGEHALGFRRMGAHRMRFMLEAVKDLREQLRRQESELLVRIGKPEEVIAWLAKECKAQAVYTSKEVTWEEVRAEEAVEEALWRHKVTFTPFWQSTLWHSDDIPWPIQNLPEVFTQFRKENEKSTPVRDLFPDAELPALSLEVEAGALPTLKGLGYEVPAMDPRAVLDFAGGETAGKLRVEDYIWNADLLKEYKETRNGMVGADYSSKFSAWLALGCLSPRYIYYEVKRYEQERVKNESTYWLIFELMWRDYFRFVCKRYGHDVFLPGGIMQKEASYSHDRDAFAAWCQGVTGVPFIDSHMRELKLTGFMSNRGRQNVASFLCKDLEIDWTWGAAWFESCLIDYDVCSNWGNWNYVAGVGNDPREGRYFNILSQASRYDTTGEHVRLWCPELAGIAGGRIHAPANLGSETLAAAGVVLGEGYPKPMVDFARWE